jgi:hypothetical protein
MAKVAKNEVFSCAREAFATHAAMSADFALQVLAVTEAAARLTVPVLRYSPPANAYQAVAGSADDYAFNGFNASVQIYPFRPFTGNIQQAFQMMLLRDWIMPQYQEENVGAPPAFATVAVPGDDLTIVANFVENIVACRTRIPAC